MAKNDYELQDWQLASDKGKTQSKPSGPLHTLMIWALIILGIAVLGVGLYLVFTNNLTDDKKALALISVTALTGILYVFVFATKTTRTPIKTLLVGLALLIGAAAIYFIPGFVAVSFRIVTGIVGLFIALTMFVNAWREHKIKVGWFGSFFWGLLYGIISVIILFSPDGTRILSVLTGLYMVLLAGSILFEAVSALFHHNPGMRRNFVINLPMVVAAYLPMATYEELNEMVKEEPDEVLYLQEPDSGKEPELIVYIHTRAGLIPGVGHCDICYKGKVYCYGDYDEATWKLGGFLADGTMALIPPESHIKMSLVDEKKILVAYGIQLTPELEEKVQEKIDQIMAKSYPWKPKAQLAEEGKIKGDPASFKDVGSEMYRESGAQFYKFEDGSPYKTYYAVSENCSEVANDIVGNTGIHLLKPNGVVTPGSYLQYLDELYEMQDTIVTDRRVYMLDENGRPVEYPTSPKHPIKLGNMSL